MVVQMVNTDVRTMTRRQARDWHFQISHNEWQEHGIKRLHGSSHLSSFEAPCVVHFCYVVCSVFFFFSFVCGYCITYQSKENSKFCALNP